MMWFMNKRLRGFRFIFFGRFFRFPSCGVKFSSLVLSFSIIFKDFRKKEWIYLSYELLSIPSTFQLHKNVSIHRCSSVGAFCIVFDGKYLPQWHISQSCLCEAFRKPQNNRHAHQNHIWYELRPLLSPVSPPFNMQIIQPPNRKTTHVWIVGPVCFRPRYPRILRIRMESLRSRSSLAAMFGPVIQHAGQFGIQPIREWGKRGFWTKEVDDGKWGSVVWYEDRRG